MDKQAARQLAVEYIKFVLDNAPQHDADNFSLEGFMGFNYNARQMDAVQDEIGEILQQAEESVQPTPAK